MMVLIDGDVSDWIVDYLINSLASINRFKTKLNCANLNSIE